MSFIPSTQKQKTIIVFDDIAELNIKELKIKLLSEQELFLAVDRLTRFKYPELRKDRVYKDIITKHTIEPKITTRNLDKFPQGVIDRIVSIIWNNSLENIKKQIKKDFRINDYLLFEDLHIYDSYKLISDKVFSGRILNFNKNSIFANGSIPQKADKGVINQIIDIFNENGYKFKKNVVKDYADLYEQIETNYRLNISGVLSLMDKKKDLPVNVKKNIEIQEFIDNKSFIGNKEIFDFAIKNNVDKNYGMPVKTVILAEGATEEKLLPIFADKQNLNFLKNGVQIIGAGGKNQVAKLYCEIKECFKIPVFILLDQDAAPIAKSIEQMLKPKDKLYLIKEGEFEDILPLNLICNSINTFYKTLGNVDTKEFEAETAMTEVLNEIWKQKGFGEFKKAEFAAIIAENIKSENDLTPTLREIIRIIKHLAK